MLFFLVASNSELRTKQCQLREVRGGMCDRKKNGLGGVTGEQTTQTFAYRNFAMEIIICTSYSNSSN